MNINKIVKEISNPHNIMGLVSAIIPTIMLIIGLVAGVSETPSSSLGSSANQSSITDVVGKPILNQGDYVVSLTGSPQKCTIAYVDKVRRIGYTAAHCISPDGEKQGDVHWMKDFDQWSDIRKIGTITAHPKYDYNGFDRFANIYDLAIIYFNDNIVIGDNIYSGDTLLDIHSVKLGDKVCNYGTSTRKINCGEVNQLHPYDFFQSTIRSQAGDSGGPTWLIDENGNTQGLVGVTSFILPDGGNDQHWGSGHAYLNLDF